MELLGVVSLLYYQPIVLEVKNKFAGNHSRFMVFCAMS